MAVVAACQQAALGSTQRALADKAAQMAQQALDHKQAAAAAAAEAEELREALIAKHVHDTDRLLAGHADAMQQAELRQAL